MRRARFNIFSIIGMVVAFGTFAFTAPTTIAKKNSEVIWVFQGNSSDDHDNPLLYSVGKESDKCIGESEIRCTITAPMIAPDQPDLDQISDETFKL